MPESELVEQWLQEHGNYLFAYAVKRLNGDRDMARDMLQETLLDAWKARASFAGRGSVRAWLAGILRHKIVDQFRRQTRSRELSEHAERDPTSDWFGSDGKWQESVKTWDANPERLSETNEFYTVLQQCMAHLPEQQRAVFSFREFNGHDTGSICRELEISTSNFHVLMHRARMALRACLDSNWFGKGG